MSLAYNLWTISEALELKSHLFDDIRNLLLIGISPNQIAEVHCIGAVFKAVFYVNFK